MKQVKKLFVVVIALCMLFTFMPAAMAATYTLQGDATIFAPPVGRKAEVRYELLEDSTAVSGAELSILGQPAGVSLNADKTAVVLDGDTIKNGSFTVTATKDEKTASKTITVYDGRHYYDFNDVDVDSTIQFVVHGIVSTIYLFFEANELKFSWDIKPLLIITFLILISNVVGWIVRTICLKHLDATFISVAMPFSAAITSIISVMVGTDTLSSGLVFGSLIMLVATILSGLSDNKL